MKSKSDCIHFCQGSNAHSGKRIRPSGRIGFAAANNKAAANINHAIWMFVGLFTGPATASAIAAINADPADVEAGLPFKHAGKLSARVGDRQEFPFVFDQ